MAYNLTDKDIIPKLWRYPSLLWLVPVFVLLVANAPAQSAEKFQPSAARSDTPRVLVLHSYHYGFTWSDNISKGIHSVLNEKDGRIEVLFEFMDTRRIHTQDYFQKLKALFKAKYGAKPIDVIICSDDHAFNFLLENGEDIFPDVPIVFCSVSGYKPWMRQGRQITGLLESIDIKSTLDTALKLHANTKEIAVITDMTRTGRELKLKAEEVFLDYAKQVRFRYLENLTLEQLQESLSALSQGTIVFLFIFSQDKAGRVFSHEQNLEILAEKCNVPIYAVWEFYLGHGIVGGKLTSGVAEGRMAGIMAKRILEGERASEIPLQQSPVQYMFDFRQLRRFNIQASKLPKESIVINRPVSFYETYGNLIWGTIALIALLCFVIGALLQNIWRRQTAEAALREREKLYRLLADNVQDVIWTMDLDLRLTYVSPSILDQQGLTVTEALARTPEQIFPPDSLRLVGKVLAEELEIENQIEKDLSRSRTLEVQIYCKDGSTIWVEAKVGFLRDQHGNPTGIIGITRDISERKQNEAALIESEEKYRQIVRHAPTGIYEIDYKQGKLISVNDVMCEITGYRREELLSINPLDLLTEDSKERYIERLRKVLADEPVPQSVEFKIRRKDGQEVWALLNIRFIYEHGNIKGAMVVAHDITDRKEAEDALRESEERYRLLVENANEAIFIIQDGVVKFHNFKTQEMTGYSEKELTRTPFINFVHPDDQEMVLERRKRRLLGEKPPSTYSFRIINKSGAELLVQINTVLITWKGAPATINFIRDISEHKRLEMQLQQAQKMKSLGTLAGGIAHDFNNLLMGIQGRTSLMLTDADSGHPYFEHLIEIENYVNSAADLTKQLLGFAWGGKYEVKATALNDLIMNQNHLFGRTRKEINIHEKFEEHLWVVEADQGQIEQVLLNIYVNAWQAMPKGGDLYIQTENVVLDPEHSMPFQVEPGKYIKISISDTGVGMDEATQQRIFDPFFTTKEMGRGAGLGLASAYGIIKNHGGFIDVFSQKGQGTTFTIYLPATDKEVIKETSLPEELQQGTETILLVDDEEFILDIGQRVLEKLGYKVLIAKSGKEATAFYEHNMDKIDMVILDMIMQEMGGGRTYDKLKDLNPNIKVLLSSGYSIDGEATKILERGCNGFIQKPFNMADLSKKLREILDQDK